jgi:predicted dehydrogenase
MNSGQGTTRRDLLLAGGAALAALSASQAEAAPEPAAKLYRIGVISASIDGKPQRTNGHTWHFASFFHPTVNQDAIRKYLDPANIAYFEKYRGKGQDSFDLIPFPDTRITHVYDADPQSAATYAEAFPGVQVAHSPEELAQEVDAVWMGDASGRGEDHFGLVSPGLRRGLPTFCDKPIGGTVEGTRKILQFAREHKAPLMSSSLFRHQWGTEQALRMRDSGEHGRLEFVLAGLGGGFSLPGWMIYAQHPVWSVVTLAGPGVETVTAYARESTCHAFLTYPDRMPAEVWYGRPDVATRYCSTAVYFTKTAYEYTPAIEGNWELGHHYEMFQMANTFRKMVRTGQEPVPHREIVEVTAIVHAGAKSLKEGSRPVKLAEVLG